MKVYLSLPEAIDAVVKLAGDFPDERIDQGWSGKLQVAANKLHHRWLDKYHPLQSQGEQQSSKETK